jgi:hypothetical protein
VPPRVECSLTALGLSLVGLVAGIRSWAEAHIEQVQEARASYDTINGTGAESGGGGEPTGAAMTGGVENVPGVTLPLVG